MILLNEDDEGYPERRLASVHSVLGQSRRRSGHLVLYNYYLHLNSALQ